MALTQEQRRELGEKVRNRWESLSAEERAARMAPVREARLARARRRRAEAWAAELRAAGWHVVPPGEAVPGAHHRADTTETP